MTRQPIPAFTEEGLLYPVIRAMQETYGERVEDFPTEFHGEIEHLPEARENSQFLGV